MEKETKSFMVMREKDYKNYETKEIPYDVVIKFFDINEPHKTTEMPKEQMKYENIHRVILKNFEINYLPRGNDLVMNDVGKIKIDHKEGHLRITKLD